MKTAISIPDDLFAAAEEMSKRLSISRSEFYARAVAEYLKTISPSEITQHLNEVYQDVDSSLDPVMHEMNLRSIGPETW